MLFHAHRLTVFVVVIASVAGVLFFETPANAETITGYKVINNYTIKQTYVPDGGTWTESTRYFYATKIPSNPGLNGGIEFRTTSIPAEYCEYYIFYGLSGGYYSLHYTPKTGSSCGDEDVTSFTPQNPSAVEYYFYKSDANTIKSLTPGKSSFSFKKVTGTMPSGAPGPAYVEVGAADKCPAMVLGDKDGTWSFFDAEDTGDTQTNSDSKFYQAIAAAAGYTDSFGCKAESDGAREASEASLARVLGQNADYYNSRNGWFGQVEWGSLNNAYPNDRVKDIKRGVAPDDSALEGSNNANSGGGSNTSYIDAGTEEECTAAGGIWNSDTSTCAADAVSTCAIDELGWAVCPLLNFIGKLNDMAFATLSGTFLETPSSLINDTDTLAAWRNFRDIANALFIIAFLFMVYSQMAGGRGKDR